MGQSGRNWPSNASFCWPCSDNPALSLILKFDFWRQWYSEAFYHLVLRKNVLHFYYYYYTKCLITQFDQHQVICPGRHVAIKSLHDHITSKLEQLLTIKQHSSYNRWMPHCFFRDIVDTTLTSIRHGAAMIVTWPLDLQDDHWVRDKATCCTARDIPSQSIVDTNIKFSFHTYSTLDLWPLK